MKEIKPTVRELRVVLNSIGKNEHGIAGHYNDQRVKGGRIKFWTKDNLKCRTTEIEVLMRKLFPSFSFRVVSYGGNSRFGLYTCHFDKVTG